MKTNEALLGWLVATSLVTAGCDRSIVPPHATDSAAPTPIVAPSTSTAPTAAAASNASETVAALTRLTFDAEKVGEPPAAFEGVVGEWRVATQGDARGLLVDGNTWRDGTPSVTLGEQAKRLYGDRYAEFLDGVKAFAFFPLAVWKGVAPTGAYRISVRFLPLGGKIDQAAGIALGIQPDGSYLVARANALEDNLLWAKVVRGKRTILDTVRNVPTATGTWHELTVVVRGSEIEVRVDGATRLRKKLDEAPVGHLGLWSKADSRVLFDDFTVTREVTP